MLWMQKCINNNKQCYIIQHYYYFKNYYWYARGMVMGKGVTLAPALHTTTELYWLCDFAHGTTEWPHPSLPGEHSQVYPPYVLIHVPPCLHVTPCVMHSSTSVRHCTPENSGGQVHENALNPSVQMPSLWQGPETHSSLSCNESAHVMFTWKH